MEDLENRIEELEKQIQTKIGHKELSLVFVSIIIGVIIVSVLL